MLQASRIAAMDTTISADRLFGLCIYVFLFLNWLHVHMDMDDNNGRPLEELGIGGDMQKMCPEQSITDK